MIKKEKALSVIFNAAVGYEEFFKGYSYAYLYISDSGKLNALQIIYNASAFMHLTGVKFRQGQKMHASSFYDMCVKRRLSLDSFELAENGTTELKLKCLQEVFSEDGYPKMSGDYYKSRINLYTEKIVGTVNWCLGTIEHESGMYFIPNTLLYYDIRKLVARTSQIIAIFRKRVEKDMYDEFIYCAKEKDITRGMLRECGLQFDEQALC